MTTGTKTTGTNGNGFYMSKTWSGTDGRYNSDGSTKENTWDCTVVRRQTTRGTYSATVGGPCVNVYTASCNASGPINPWGSNAEIAFLSKLAEKAKGHKFNLAVFAAQGNKVVEQSLNTLSSFACVVKNLKRGRIDKAFACLGLVPGQRKRKFVKRKLDAGDVSGAWLAMMYGWLPTLSDLYESAKAYEALTSQRSSSFVISGKRETSYEASQSPGVFKAPGKRSVSHRMHYTLHEYLSVPRTLGLTDPASVVWELVPFSFVVDWFIPIGSYFEALAVIPELKGSWKRTSLDKSSAHSAYTRPGACTTALDLYERKVYKRTHGTTLAVPKPRFVFDDNLRGNRIYNAIALVHQLTR